MSQSIVEKVRAAGVVGSGGAGFPTHVKIASNVEHVLANGASCEPLLESDPYLMEHCSELVLDGLSKVVECVNADKGTVCLKSKYGGAVQSITDTIKNSAFPTKTDLFEMENFYPAGDEFILVYEALGRVVPQGGIPLNVGTVVCNIETLLNISRAVEGKPVTDRYVTVGGEVRNPMVCKVPIGTPSLALVEMAGGSLIEDFVILMGGPMMGEILETGKEPVTKTTSGIIVLPSDHYIPMGKKPSFERMRHISKSACTGCSRCTDLCPRFLLGHKIRPHKVMRRLGYTVETTEDVFGDTLVCSGCGVCEIYACPMMLAPREINVFLKQKFMSEGKQPEQVAVPPPVSPFFNIRKIPVNRLMERLNVKNYDVHPDFHHVDIGIDEVRVPLSQHIGKAAEPVVKVGDKVKKDDLIGEIPEKALGARVHASISGIITAIDDCVVIKR